MADELELEAEIKKVWWPRGVPNGCGDILLPLLPLLSSYVSLVTFMWVKQVWSIADADGNGTIDAGELAGEEGAVALRACRRQDSCSGWVSSCNSIVVLCGCVFQNWVQRSCAS